MKGSKTMTNTVLQQSIAIPEPCLKALHKSNGKVHRRIKPIVIQRFYGFVLALVSVLGAILDNGNITVLLLMLPLIICLLFSKHYMLYNVNNKLKKVSV